MSEPHILPFHRALVVHVLYLGDTIRGRRTWRGRVRLGWAPVLRPKTDPGVEAHLKHCSRSPRANRPAWYSSPSITEGTVSVSCTMTAISLSRFPSMLRSLMLAEPIGETVMLNNPLFVADSQLPAHSILPC